MSTVTVQLTPVTEQVLRKQALKAGQSLEVYIERLAEQAARDGTLKSHGSNVEEQARFLLNPSPTEAEFGQLLRELTEGPPLQSLPTDFSRTDMYDEHD